MEDTSTPFLELLTKSLPLNPILSALVANPAVVDASRRAVSELVPVVERSLKGVRAGKLVGVAAPSVLVTCFAAGVAVGWMTAPAKGAETRERAKARVREWSRIASDRAKAGTAYLVKRFSRRGRAGENVQGRVTEISVTHAEPEAPRSGPVAHH
ncbi:MAG: hypothetical protein GX607_00350 [Myxococcales bacterium]|nr:hypothetical protein [Myxococcales bacterium]